MTVVKLQPRPINSLPLGEERVGNDRVREPPRKSMEINSTPRTATRIRDTRPDAGQLGLGRSPGLVDAPLRGVLCQETHRTRVHWQI